MKLHKKEEEMEAFLMKTEKQIRKVLDNLFKNKLEIPFDIFIARTLKWVLGEDDDFLDYLLEVSN
jgi:hypothetical protein